MKKTYGDYEDELFNMPSSKLKKIAKSKGKKGIVAGDILDWERVGKRMRKKRRLI